MMTNLISRRLAALFIPLLLTAHPAAAMVFQWGGTLSLVEEDTGGGDFSGNGVGAMFTGEFRTDATCGTGCSSGSDPNEADYEFELGMTFGGLLSDGTTTATGDVSYIVIQNDLAIDAEEAALLSFLLGSPVAAGTLVDTWTVGAESDAVYDMNDDELIDGGFVEVVYLSFDTTLFDDTSFRALPPALADVDLRAFLIEEADAGETTYLAFGTVDSFAVPEPSLALLLAPALLAGGWVRRRSTMAG